MPQARCAAHGFDDWYLRRDLTAPLSPFDEQLSEAAFAARDEFPVAILEKTGLNPVSRELLDRVNPTGSWRDPVRERSPLRTRRLRHMY
jgi:hypothetical protein